MSSAARLIRFILSTSIQISLVQSVASEGLPNYCQNPRKQQAKSNDGDLIGSVIQQMQINAKGSLDCVSLVANEKDHTILKGNSISYSFCNFAAIGKQILEK